MSAFGRPVETLPLTPFPAISHIRWRRLDVPGWEEARVERSDSGWILAGDLEVEERGAFARFRYEIECDRGWRTRSTRIEGELGGAAIEIAFLADGEGEWTIGGRLLPELAGALDVDLSFTPATNTLPIQRLGLAVGERAEVCSAWLRFPELQLEPLEQMYAREADLVYLYSTRVNGEPFTARLETDLFGRVLSYEGLWHAES